MKTPHIIILSVFIALNSFNCLYAQPSDKNKKINVAVFVYNGMEILDFAGPSEVFADAYKNGESLCNVYTVAVSTDEVTAQGFLKIKPNYFVSTCPNPDVIVLPGGDTRSVANNASVQEWLKKNHASGSTLLSVCTGVFMIAESGLLTNKIATTHYCCQDDLAKDYPAIKVVKETRFVDNGKIITTEGISAGIDGSLYLLEKLFDYEVAKNVAHYMMYDWRPKELKKVVN